MRSVASWGTVNVRGRSRLVGRGVSISGCHISTESVANITAKDNVYRPTSELVLILQSLH